MARLAECCKQAGFLKPETYLASGNAVFQSKASESQVCAALEAQLTAYAGKPVGVLVRSAEEMAGVVARNPFAGENGSRVTVLFSVGALPQNPLDGIKHVQDEVIRVGERELFIFYPNGQADRRLQIPALKTGTSRNMNTVGKLAELAQEIANL